MHPVNDTRRLTMDQGRREHFKALGQPGDVITVFTTAAR